MKKLLALLLCCALLVCLLAACSGDSDASAVTPSDVETEAPATETGTEAPATEAGTEEHDHTHVNYKGLENGDYTLDDVIAVEGREPDLTYEVDETTTLYIYNDVTLNDLFFSQVQFSFGDSYNRISCTCGGDEEQAVTVDRILQSMSQVYGEPTASGDTYRWGDGHTANYANLSVLNETTVQLAFYFYATEG